MALNAWVNFVYLRIPWKVDAGTRTVMLRTLGNIHFGIDGNLDIGRQHWLEQPHYAPARGVEYRNVVLHLPDLLKTNRNAQNKIR
jgi:hypothetical protein